MNNSKKDVSVLEKLLAEGQEKRLIRLSNDLKTIHYLKHGIKRNYANPEEAVQADAYLHLILEKEYAPERIRLFVTVTMGSSNREADLIVYSDDEYNCPFIVVECKRPEVSELEFSHAVNQAFSYAVAEGAKYVWVTSSLKNEYYQVSDKKPKARKSIPDIPACGASELLPYKYAKGGGKAEGQKLLELSTVTEEDLTRRFKQAHQALWGGGELNPSEAFDELDKLIFCKLWDERKHRNKGEPYDFQIFLEKDEETANRKLLDRIKALYEEGRKKEPEVFKDGIRLSPSKARTVVSYLESINLGDTDLDSKGRAFETFMGSFFRGDFGQFFTPRPIVNFIVEVLPIKNDSLVLDTSCGSGGFLLHALDKVRKQANSLYRDHETNVKDAKSHYAYWHDFAQKNLYGIEINEQIARTAKMNMIIHDDGHTNVVAADGLVSDKELREKTKNQGFKYGQFDFIITNPPFGSSVKQTERAYMHQYRLATKEVDWLNPKSKAAERPSQSTEVLFIEQCHKYLNEGGYLAIVVPDGVLTNSSLQYVRDSIEEMYRIVAVVSMPQTAFQHTGAGVKSSVLFLRKHSEAVTERIQEQKKNLQESLKKKHSFIDKLDNLENQKNKEIKQLKGFNNPDGLIGQALKESESYKEWKNKLQDTYSEKVDELKEQLFEEYLELKQKELEDYQILMAIAEDIGYDATGKPTGNNQLDVIAPELSRFIDAIEEGNT